MARARSTADLKGVFGRYQPTSLARDQVIGVAPALSGLLPEGGLRRGSTVVVGGMSGATSLALCLLAEASSAGSWCAVVGAGSLGLVAASELGVELGRLVLVPAPGPRWGTVAAALLDALDVVVLCPPTVARPPEARSLSDRARHRGSVLVVLASTAAGAAGEWPSVAEVSLGVAGGAWRGIDGGHGRLRGRRVEVVSGGRRAAAKGARAELWLPGPGGDVERVGASVPAAAPPAGASSAAV
jgi:hypothetical protein